MILYHYTNGHKTMTNLNNSAIIHIVTIGLKLNQYLTTVWFGLNRNHTYNADVSEANFHPIWIWANLDQISDSCKKLIRNYTYRNHPKHKRCCSLRSWNQNIKLEHHELAYSFRQNYILYHIGLRRDREWNKNSLWPH